MRKISILFISYFYMFIGMYEVNACPEGSTYSIYNFTINDCVYEALVCWKCPTGYMSEHWITVNYFKKVDPNCSNGLTPQQVSDSIFKRINTAAWIWGLCIGFPPCDTPLPYYIIRYNCWYMYNDGGNLRYEVCDYRSWCQWDGTICWDNLLGPVRNEVRTWYQVGTINCSPFWPGAPPPGETSDCGTFTSCP